MGSLLGILVETRGRNDWTFASEPFERVGSMAPFVWIEVPATMFTIGDEANLEAFAKTASQHFDGRAFAVMAQTTAACQNVVEFERGREVRRVVAVESEWVFEGEPRPWEEAYFFGSREAPLDDFYVGESEREWERFCTEDVEVLADEGLMMPGIYGVERLLGLFDVSWARPFATWTPPSQRRGTRRGWLGVALVLGFFGFMFWLGAR